MASATARRNPMTKRSGSLFPLTTPPDSGTPGSATTPSTEETKFA
jgi:hypothetical protein